MTKLIVNADDLGADENVDRGIIDVFQRGILTSATLLITFSSHWETSAQRAVEAGLPIGLHLSLTHGHAIARASDIPDLADPSGRFRLSADRLILLGFQSRGRNEGLYGQIRTELDAQIKAVLERGIPLTHLDTHQHVHSNPAIFAVLEALAHENGIGAVRLVRERLFPFQFYHGVLENLRRKNLAKSLLVSSLARRIRPRLPTNDAFYGVMQSDTIDKWSFLRFVKAVAGTNLIWEVGMHPGYSSGAPNSRLHPKIAAWFTSPSRRRELDVLLDPDVIRLVREEQIELISYANVS